MQSTAAIQVRNLRMGYPGKVLLDDVDFDVQRGEIFVILGGSGCGKSTLLKHMIGLYPPLAGEIRIEGEDIVHAHGAARLKILRRFGVMYQSGALFGSMTVLENVLLPLEHFTSLPHPARELVALNKLNSVGLLAAANKMPSELSGGMQKRAAIARAMALDPGILFLDEPSAGLDPVTSAEIDDLIQELSRNAGITFVIVTHELPSIFAVADQVIVLDAETRSILARGNPHAVRDESDHPWVRRFFRRESRTPSEP
jgi:phospholipid/cholesterol/gamma-HCH transport system ATP-binding protein